VILPRIGAVLLALLGVGLLFLVRLDTTWGHRPFDATEMAQTAAGLAMLVAAVLGWQRPALGWAGLGLFALVALLIATRGADIADWLDSPPDARATTVVMPTE
jgi:hypothetical protein